jgi:hypothetical protein
VNVHLSLPPCRSDITFIYVACGTPARVIISIRFLIPCINVWKMGLRTFMRMHKPYHSFIRGQLMVMLQVHNIVVPITPFYRPSPSSALCNLFSCFPFQFFLHTLIVTKTLLVAKEPLYLRALPSVPHIKPCQLCVVTIILICVFCWIDPNGRPTARDSVSGGPLDPAP